MDARFSTLGTHLLLELNDCNPDALDDIDLVKETLLVAAAQAGATILADIFHKFSPVGVTGIVSIAESHLSIHTWPEYAYAAVDIFTCGERFNPYKAAHHIIERLQCRQHSITEIKRGASMGAATPLSEPITP